MRVQGATAFRLLLETPGDGQRNMAVDEALLTAVGAGRSPPTLRLYGFAPPTLSLGRFQKARELLRLETLAADGIRLVRRPTGGQAVLHDRELTYAVVLGRGHLEPFSKREVYQFIAGLLLTGLEALGIRARSGHSRLGSAHNPDCFRSTGEYEIADAGQRKLIGSAQVLSRTASLQHGAIPLDGSYRRVSGYLLQDCQEEHALPASLGEELGHEVSFPEAELAFEQGARFALERLGLRLEAGELSAEEVRGAEELRSEKYARDEWNLLY